MAILSTLSSVWSVLTKVYNFPGVKQILEGLVKSYLRKKVQESSNTIDDKIVDAIEAGLRGENYKAILNGKKKVTK